jgi:general secretion pathway protein D
MTTYPVLRFVRLILLGASVCLLGACGTLPATPSPGHITYAPAPPVTDIPKPVQRSVTLPPPQPSAPVETYSVVVHDVPLRELLFALARDAKINVDIDPGITGQISLNAIDQTLEHILHRVARQADVQYTWDGPNLVISPDRPHIRHYRVDYVNMSRAATGTVGIRSTVGSTGGVVGETGGGGVRNESTFGIELAATNDFWATLTANLASLVIEEGDATGAASSESGGPRNIVVNREAGLIGVRGTARQHTRVREFLDQVMSGAQRQVLIEATIVEIELNDDYQAGVDWAQFGASDRGSTTVHQNLLGSDLALAPSFKLDAVLWEGAAGSLKTTLRALSRFGDTRVLSSPRLMVLNNQSAVLKVVDEVVYFEISRETIEATATSPARTEFTSEIRTAPVGLVMMVTPQISAGDIVSLNVRPTVSRIVDFKADPAARVFGDAVENLIPQIQVRELESVLRVASGQTAVLGGLMQDDIRNRTSGLPGAARLPVFGNLFSYRDDVTRKSELVVFLRPVVIRNAGLDGDLAEYRRYLPDPNGQLNSRSGLYQSPGAPAAAATEAAQ